MENFKCKSIAILAILFAMLTVTQISAEVFDDRFDDGGVEYDKWGYPGIRTLDENTPITMDDLLESYYANDIWPRGPIQPHFYNKASMHDLSKASVRVNVVDTLDFSDNLPIADFYVTGRDTSVYFENDDYFDGSVNFKVRNHRSADRFKLGLTSHIKQVENENSKDYAKDGWEGTLQQYVYSGSDTHTKQVENEESPNYNKDGYIGTLQPYQVDDQVKYRGEVTKPDDRVYKYRGTVTAVSYLVDIHYSGIPKGSNQYNVKKHLVGEMHNLFTGHENYVQNSSVPFDSGSHYGFLRLRGDLVSDEFDLAGNVRHNQENIQKNANNLYLYYRDPSNNPSTKGRVNKYSIKDNPYYKCKPIKRLKMRNGFQFDILNKCEPKNKNKVKVIINRNNITYFKGDLEVLLSNSLDFVKLKNDSINQTELAGYFNSKNDAINLSLKIRDKRNVFYSYTVSEYSSSDNSRTINVYLSECSSTNRITLNNTNTHFQDVYAYYSSNAQYLGMITSTNQSFELCNNFTVSQTGLKTHNSNSRRANVNKLNNIDYNDAIQTIRLHQNEDSKLIRDFYRFSIPTLKIQVSENAKNTVVFNNPTVRDKFLISDRSPSYNWNIKQSERDIETQMSDSLKSILVKRPFLKLDYKYKLYSGNLRDFDHLDLHEDITISKNNRKIKLVPERNTSEHLRSITTDRIKRAIPIAFYTKRWNQVGDTVPALTETDEGFEFTTDINKISILADLERLFKYQYYTEYGGMYPSLRTDSSYRNSLWDENTPLIFEIKPQYRTLDKAAKYKVEFNRIPGDIKDYRLDIKLVTGIRTREYDKDSIKTLTGNKIKTGAPSSIENSLEDKFNLDLTVNANTKFYIVVESADPEFNKRYEIKSVTGFSFEDPVDDYTKPIVLTTVVGPKNAFTGTINWIGKPYNAVQTITGRANGTQVGTKQVNPEVTSYYFDADPLTPEGEQSQFEIDVTNIPNVETTKQGLNITNRYLGRTQTVYVPVTLPHNTEFNPFYVKLFKDNGEAIGEAIKVDPIPFSTRPKNEEALVKVLEFNNIRIDDDQGNIIINQAKISTSQDGPWETSKLVQTDYTLNSNARESKLNAECEGRDLCGNNGKFSAPSITVAFNPETIQKQGTVSWVGDDEDQSNRKDFTIQLKNGSQVIEDLSIQKIAQNYQFTNRVPVRDKFGDTINYTIEFKDLQNLKYDLEVSQEGNLTLRYSPDKINKRQSIEWQAGITDPNFKVTCKLLKDNNIESQKELMYNQSECSFQSLAAKDTDGRKFNYTIEISSDQHRVTPREGQSTLITYVPPQGEVEFTATIINNKGFKLLTNATAEVHGALPNKVKDITFTKEQNAQLFLPVRETLPLRTETGALINYTLKNPTPINAFELNASEKNLNINFINEKTTLNWKSRFQGGETQNLQLKYRVKDRNAEVASKKLNNEELTHSMSDLDKYSEDGTPINWLEQLSVIEVPDNWRQERQNDVFIWTYIPAIGQITLNSEIEGGYKLLTQATVELWERSDGATSKIKDIIFNKDKDAKIFQSITENVALRSASGQEKEFYLKNPTAISAFELKPEGKTLKIKFINEEVNVQWKSKYINGDNLTLTPKYRFRKDDFVKEVKDLQPRSTEHSTTGLKKYDQKGNIINWLEHLEPIEVPQNWSASFEVSTPNTCVWTYTPPKGSKTFKIDTDSDTIVVLAQKSQNYQNINKGDTEVTFNEIELNELNGDVIDYTLDLMDNTKFTIEYKDATQTYVIRKKPGAQQPPSQENDQYQEKDITIKVIWDTDKRFNLPIRLTSKSYVSDYHTFGITNNREETFKFSRVKVYNANFGIDYRLQSGFAAELIDSKTLRIFKSISIIDTTPQQPNQPSKPNPQSDKPKTQQPITIGPTNNSSTPITPNTPSTDESYNRNGRDSQSNRNEQIPKDESLISSEKHQSRNETITTTTPETTSVTNTPVPTTPAVTTPAIPSIPTPTTPSVPAPVTETNTPPISAPVTPAIETDSKPTPAPVKPTAPTPTTETDSKPITEIDSKQAEPIIKQPLSVVPAKQSKEETVKVTEITTESKITGNANFVESDEKPKQQYKLTKPARQVKQDKPILLTREDELKVNGVGVEFKEVKPKVQKQSKLLEQGEMVSPESNDVYAYTEDGQPIFNPVLEPVYTGQDGEPIFAYDGNGNPIYHPITTKLHEDKSVISNKDDGTQIFGYTKDGEPIYKDSNKQEAELTNVILNKIKELVNKFKNLKPAQKAAAAGGALVTTSAFGWFIFRRR